MGNKAAKKPTAKAAEPKPKKPKKPKLVMPDLSRFDQGGSPKLGHQRTQQISEKIGRSWGKTTAMPFELATSTEIKFLPWGLLMPDWLTRGLPIGYMTRIWGPSDAFKTTLCMRMVRQAQNFCRHCKTPLVRHPACGCKKEGKNCDIKEGNERCVDCRCPTPRWWLLNPDDFGWLPTDVALKLSKGILPEGTKLVKADHPELGKCNLPALECAPPQIAHFKADGRTKVKKAPQPKQVIFTPAMRCEPWRIAYLETENKISQEWAVRNGVDLESVLLIGESWGEKSLEITEKAVKEREFDLIIIDSISMLESEVNLQKSYDERVVVASHANMIQRFVKRHIAACFEEGLTARYKPTVLMTSQARMGGIGGYKSHPHLIPTGGNALKHGIILDIRMKAAGYQYDPTQTFAIRGDFEFKVIKNQAGGSPGVIGTVKFWVNEQDGPDGHGVGDSDDLDTVLNYARGIGKGYAVDGTGKAKVTLYSDFIQGGSIGFPTIGMCKNFLRDHLTVYDDLRTRVLDRLRGQRRGALTTGKG